MHRQRLELAERARQEKLEALEKEILAKQRRAEQIRSERLLQRKGGVARFSRRALGPDSNDDSRSVLNQDSERKLLMPSSLSQLSPSGSSLLGDYPLAVGSVKSKNVVAPPATSRNGFSARGMGLKRSAGIEGPTSRQQSQARPQTTLTTAKSIQQRSMPTSPLTSLTRIDENIRRCFVNSNSRRSPRGPAGHLRALSTAMSTASRAAENNSESPVPDDIWTGRGLVLDETELRKVSLFNNTPNSKRSSSGDSFEIIEPKATAQEPLCGGVVGTENALSCTPISQSGIFLAAPSTSPPRPLSTVSETSPLGSQPLLSNRTWTISQQQRRLTSLSLRYTPVCNFTTPSCNLSPVYNLGCMAPRRRCSVGRSAIVHGITSGSAVFVDVLTRSGDRELDYRMPIPPRVQHLFSYTDDLSATPLTLAVKTSSAELVKALIEAQVDVFHTDPNGRTLLHLLFLPPPDQIDPRSLEGLSPAPFRLPEHDIYDRPSLSGPPLTSPRTSLQHATPRINADNDSAQADQVPGKCRVIEACQPGWASNLDNRANIVEYLICAGVSAQTKDDDGKFASEYAREWLWQAHRELNNVNISTTDKISACCVRAACLALLTFEDYLRLAYLAPIATNYKVRKLLRPRLSYEDQRGNVVHIKSSFQSPDRTPDKILSMVRGKSQVRRRVTRHVGTAFHRSTKHEAKRASAADKNDPLKMFIEFSKKHKDHPAHLRVLEFLGAGFECSNNT